MNVMCELVRSFRVEGMNEGIAMGPISTVLHTSMSSFLQINKQDIGFLWFIMTMMQAFTL